MDEGGEAMNEIVIMVATLVCSTISAVVTHLLNKSRHKAEVDNLRAELKQSNANANGTNLDNTQKLIDMIMQQVAVPLESEVKKLRSEIRKFTKAIGKINTCSLADNCPVKHELQNSADNSE